MKADADQRQLLVTRRAAARARVAAEKALATTAANNTAVDQERARPEAEPTAGPTPGQAPAEAKAATVEVDLSTTPRTAVKRKLSTSPTVDTDIDGSPRYSNSEEELHIAMEARRRKRKRSIAENSKTAKEKYTVLDRALGSDAANALVDQEQAFARRLVDANRHLEEQEQAQRHQEEQLQARRHQEELEAAKKLEAAKAEAEKLEAEKLEAEKLEAAKKLRPGPRSPRS